MIRLFLLGSTRCIGPDGSEIDSVARSPKRLALLSYLAVARPRGFHRRDALLGLLWPEFDQQHARANLRQTVRQLRAELGGVVVGRGRGEIAIDPEALWCDAVEFDRLIERGELEAALDLYERDLLESFYVGGANDFQQWLEIERGRLRRLGIRAAWSAAEASGSLDVGARWARRAARFAPRDERAARRLMSFLDERGDPVAALREYEAFRRRVESELDMVAGPATRALAEVIRERAGGPMADNDPAVSSETDRPLPAVDDAAAVQVDVLGTPIPAHGSRVLRVAALVLTVAITVGMGGWLTRGPESIRLGSVTRITPEDGLELYPSLSPDGAEVAYMAGPPAQFDVLVRRVSGGDPVSITQGLSGSHAWPAWSPDGERIAYVTVEDVNEFSLRVSSALGGARRTLVKASGGNRIHSPTWSPDGREIAFVHGHAIYSVSVDTGETIKLGEGWEPNLPAWSPDGHAIAFVSENSQYAGALELGNHAPSSIWVLSLDGSTPHEIVEAGATNHSPAWISPRRLLFVSDREGARDLYALDLDPSYSSVAPPVRLTTGLDLLTVGVSRDGTRVVYDRPILVANLWRVPVPPSSDAPIPISLAERLTSGHQFIETLRVSPDGEWIAFDSDLNGNHDVFKMRVDGGEQLQLTTHPADDFAPSWSPTRDEIAFYSFRDGTRDVFVMDRLGLLQTRVTGQPGSEAFPSYSPDGRAMSLQYAPLPEGDSGVTAMLALIGRERGSARWSAPTIVMEDPVQVPRWSPTGPVIAFFARQSLNLYEVETGERRMLHGSIDYRGPPVWAPDGQSLYVAGTIDDVTGIWRFGLSGEAEELLVSLERPFLRRMWLDTDGRFFYFTESETTEASVFTLEVAGG